MRRFAILTTLAAGCLSLLAPPALANRAVLNEELLQMNAEAGTPPPEAQIEGACGAAVSGSSLYVSDYYHRVVDIFATSGTYGSQIALPGGPFTGLGINRLDAVCGLASGPGGVLYANEFHEGVLRLKPSEAVFDTGESTGVATDSAGDLYVDDRTYVAVYEPSGAPVEVGGEPLRIGEGALGDAYGLAVAPDGSRVYVPDAASGDIKVFEPSGEPSTPVATISSGFVSLVDAALALDPTNGHLLVVDDAQPGYEHPGAAIYEFGPAPSYTSLGRLACAPVDGGPSGIALDSSGNLYVTDGNSERSNVYEYGPYTTGSAPTPACASAASFSSSASAAAPATVGSASAAVSGEGDAATITGSTAAPRAHRKHRRPHRHHHRGETKRGRARR